MSAFADGSMDLIVSNPPYVPLGDKAGLQREVRDWEPHVALFAGPTGLEIYERLVRDAERVLGPGGWRWTVTNKNLAGANITAIAASGLDLYARTDPGKWRWLGIGQPKFPDTTAALVIGIPATEREF